MKQNTLSTWLGGTLILLSTVTPAFADDINASISLIKVEGAIQEKTERQMTIQVANIQSGIVSKLEATIKTKFETELHN